MTTWNVKRIPTGTVSDDGMQITMEIDFGAGRKGKLVIPFDQLDFLQQSLLSLAVGAYDRQVATGRLAASVNAVDTAKCEGLRVMTNGQDILVQMNLRPAPNAPLGMGSFCVDRELALHLSTRLQECAEQIRQASRPS